MATTTLLSSLRPILSQRTRIATMAAYSNLAQSSADPRDAKLVIRELLPGMVTFSQPFERYGVLPIGGRSTAINLPGKGTFVYVSHPYTDATKKAIEQLGGEVKWLVTPDGEHGMNIAAWAEQFPDAKVIGVSRFGKEKPNVKWEGLFGAGGEDKTYGFEPEITLHQVSAHRNDELTAIHHPSGTLLEADMLFNLPPTEQYSRVGGTPGWYRFLGIGHSFAPGGRLHKQLVEGVVKNHELAKKEMAPIFAAKWDRLVPCHGDVIETGGRVKWDEVWGKYAPESESKL